MMDAADHKVSFVSPSQPPRLGSLEPPANSSSAGLEKSHRLVTESMIRRRSPRIDVREAGEVLMRSVSLVYSRKSRSGKESARGSHRKLGEEDKKEDKEDEEKKKEALKRAADRMKKYVESDWQTVCASFKVDPKNGLSSSQVAELREKFPLNELERDAPDPLWLQFLSQFTDLLVIMLIMAAIVAIALGQYEASGTIILIVVANAWLGVMQDRKAGQALAALEAMSSPTVDIIRDGKRQTVDSSQLLPGDIVYLETGNRISADCRLIDSHQLQVNEMPLTGETDGVAKDAEYVAGRAETAGAAPSPAGGTGEDSKQPPPPVAPQLPPSSRGLGAKAHSRDESKEQAESRDLESSYNSRKGLHTERDNDAGKQKLNAAGSAPGTQRDLRAALVNPAGTTSASARDGEKAKEKEKGGAGEETLTDRNMVYMGCSVLDGRARAVVVATGMQTKMGEIAALLKDADGGDTPLQMKLESLGKRLGIASLVVSLIVFVVGVASSRGADPNSTQPVWLQMLLIAVSLTVAAVPEGLPACVTITLAVGMNHMVKKNALIRNLKSVETLGSATVICTDKTGTLTMGKMTAVHMYTCGEYYNITGEGYDPTGEILLRRADGSLQAIQPSGAAYKALLVCAVLCCNAEPFVNEAGEHDVRGSSTERPIVVAALKGGVDGTELRKRYTRIVENPFNSQRKMMSVLVDVRDGVSGVDSRKEKELAKEGFPKGSLANAIVVVQDLEEKVNDPHSSRGITATHLTANGSGSASASGGSTPLPSASSAPLIHVKPTGATHSANGSNSINGIGGTAAAGSTGSSPVSFFHAPYVACVKGAPQGVLDACNNILDDSTGTARTMTADDRARLLAAVDSYSSEALRVLAIAFQPLHVAPPAGSNGGEVLERSLTFVGLIAAMDPVRPEVPSALEKAADAGIRTIMITGDYIKTAEAIGRKIGLLQGETSSSNSMKAIDCATIRSVQHDIEEVEKRLKDAREHKMRDRSEQLKQKRYALLSKLDSITAIADVYARARPVDKITIVRSLQRQGHVVAMTGDGVNDAPALKQANIGVAMGKNGTDVAKAASDMVLTDDNYASIVAAVEEGRVVFQNISKFVYYLMSTNISEVLVIFIAVLVGVDSPLVPIQILWLNLATDGFPAIALAVEDVEADVMSEGPRLLTDPIIDKVMVCGIVIQTFTLTGTLMLLYFWALYDTTGSWTAQVSKLSYTTSVFSANQACTDFASNGTLTSTFCAAHTTPASSIDAMNCLASQQCSAIASVNAVIQSARDDGVVQAQTLTILAIVTAELLRAYGSRSIRNSIFVLGHNKWMHYSVLCSLALTYIFFNVPGLYDKVFLLDQLSGRQWGIMFAFSFIPITVDELTKVGYQITGFGKRSKGLVVVAKAETVAVEGQQASGLSSPSSQKQKEREKDNQNSQPAPQVNKNSNRVLPSPS